MDKAILIILKKSISYDEIQNLTTLFDRICIEEPHVYIFSNFKKSYDWELNNCHILHFYHFLENINKDNYVFIRIGENVEDTEVSGDCYCNFKKYLNNYDFKIIRDIKITKRSKLRKIERKQEALKYFLEFLENINFDDGGQFDKKTLTYIMEETIKTPKSSSVKNNIIEFDYNGKHYIISKNSFPS